MRKSAAALLLHRASAQRFDAIVTGASEKGTGCASRSQRSKAKSCADSRASTSAIASRRADPYRRRARLHRFRPRRRQQHEPDAETITAGVQEREFLDSDDARPLRILAEYLAPLQAFRREQISRHGRLLRIGATRARWPARALLRRSTRAGAARHRLVEEPPLARARRYVVCSGGGGGIMEAANRGRLGGRWANHRAQHRVAARAAAEPLSSRRELSLRVPLFLHAQAVVRAPGAGAGRLSRRLRHPGRADRDPDAAADRQARAPDSRRCFMGAATGKRSSISTRSSGTA